MGKGCTTRLDEVQYTKTSRNAPFLQQSHYEMPHYYLLQIRWDGVIGIGPGGSIMSGGESNWILALYRIRFNSGCVRGVGPLVEVDR